MQIFTINRYNITDVEKRGKGEKEEGEKRKERNEAEKGKVSQGRKDDDIDCKIQVEISAYLLVR